MIALLAEDNRNVAILAKRMFTPLCDEVHIAASYQEVHDFIQRNDKLHLAALDVFLPDGRTDECVATIAYIRSKFPHCIIMVWSGYPEVAEGDMMRAGADGFLQKGPNFTMNHLYDLLLAAIDRRALIGGDPKEDTEFYLRVMEHVAKVKKEACESKT
jgi:CheY-like chemotaxis protein